MEARRAGISLGGSGWNKVVRLFVSLGFRPPLEVGVLIRDGRSFR